MQKGKLGICLWVYPLLAFLLAIFGQPLMCLVLFLFALGVEKNEWASRQTLQAFLLSLVSSLLNYVFGTILGAITSIPFIGGVIDGFFGIIEALISIVVLVFAIIGMVRVCKGNEANVPIFGSIANRAFGMVRQKVVYQQPYQQQVPPQNPQNPQNPQM